MMRLLQQTGVAGSTTEQVSRLAALGTDQGLKGFVASPHEIKPLRAQFGNKITLVVPGIRPLSSAAGDQKRVMTPARGDQAGRRLSRHRPSDYRPPASGGRSSENPRRN